MRDFGIVTPGSTLYIPFATYDSNDPTASVTMTGLAVTDIEVYKDGSVTQRASDSGYALLDTDGTDFDGITGIHGISIDLSDNTTANFWAAGSQYWVVLSSVTVDAGTVSTILATFRIGYPSAVLNTTIATLSTQTSFTLTNGPAEDDALNGREVIIHDVASGVQAGHAVVSDYTGSTKTVTLAAATTFTVAAGDNISVMGLAPLTPTTAGRTLDVTATGAAGIDWANVENQSTSVDLSATAINLCDTITTYTGNTVQTGDAFARLGAPAGASVSADIADIPTVSEFNARTLVAANYFDPSTDTVTLADGAHGGASATLTLSDYSNFQGSAGSDRLLLIDTTIATLSTQTSFTLTAGSADDDAYNGCTIVIEDASTSNQKAVGIVDDYTGSTRTVTLLEDPGVFTMATTDKVYILAEKSVKPTASGNYHLTIDATGRAGADVQEIEGASATASALSDFLINGFDGANNRVYADVTNITGSVIQEGNIANGAITGDKLTTAPAGWITYDAYANNAQADIRALIESQRQRHTVQGNIYFVDPSNGTSHALGARGGPNDPYSSIQDCHDNAVTDSNHDLIWLVSGAAAGVTTLTENVTLSKRYLQIRGPGRDFVLQAASNTDTVTVTADGIDLEGFRIKTTGVGSGKGVQATSVDFFGCSGMWFESTQGDAIELVDCTNARIYKCNLQDAGQSGSGNGITITAGNGQSCDYCRIIENYIENTPGNAIEINVTGTGTNTSSAIIGNKIFNTTGNAIDIEVGAANTVVADNRFAGNGADYVNASLTSGYTNNEDILDAIWLDTVNGSDGDPGLPSQPVATVARAKTLASDLNKIIRVIPGSSVTLASTYNGYTFLGTGWTLALGGQDISNSRFEGATVSGTGTGTTPVFFSCDIGTCTLSPSRFQQCRFTSTLTAGSGGAWLMGFCESGVAGTSAPTFNLASTGSNTLDISTWARGLTVSGLSATDTATLNGVFNTITLNGADATVNISGQYGTLTNNLTGSPTVSVTNAFRTALISEMAGSTFDSSTDSLESIRNRGDVAWITGGGGGGGGSSVSFLEASINTIQLEGVLVD